MGRVREVLFDVSVATAIAVALALLGVALLFGAR